MSSLLIATSRYTQRHPLFSRNQAMVEFLQRKQGFGFNKVSVLYPDEVEGGNSPKRRILTGGVEELRFGLKPLRGTHPAIEPAYAANKILAYFRKFRLQYDYCIAADLTGWQIAYPLRRLGCVSSLIYDDQDYFPWVIKNLQGRFTSIGLEKVIAKVSDAVVSASESLANLRRRQGARRVIVIPNGVDPSFLALRKIDYSKRLSRKTIFYAGYLSHEYGLDLLIKAFGRLGRDLGAKLVLAGVGPLEAELEQLASAGHMNSDVRLLGKVDHTRLVTVMSDVTVGVAPFLESSGAGFGVPLKIKEYMAVGLPVVTTKIGEISKFMDSRDFGVAVEPTPDALARALSGILGLSLSNYRDMGERARSAAADYSWDGLYAEYFRVLRELLN